MAPSALTIVSIVYSVSFSDILWLKLYRVKSGNFGHQVYSDIHLQIMSRLIRIFTVCLVNLLFHSNN